MAKHYMLHTEFQDKKWKVLHGVRNTESKSKYRGKARLCIFSGSRKRRCPVAFRVSKSHSHNDQTHALNENHDLSVVSQKILSQLELAQHFDSVRQANTFAIRILHPAQQFETRKHQIKEWDRLRSVPRSAWRVSVSLTQIRVLTELGSPGHTFLH